MITIILIHMGGGFTIIMLSTFYLLIEDCEKQILQYSITNDVWLLCVQYISCGEKVFSIFII